MGLSALTDMSAKNVAVFLEGSPSITLLKMINHVNKITLFVVKLMYFSLSVQQSVSEIKGQCAKGCKTQVLRLTGKKKKGRTHLKVQSVFFYFSSSYTLYENSL